MQKLPELAAGSVTGEERFPLAARALAEVGWTPDRAVDIEADLAALASEGYEVPGATVAFLASFSYLDLMSSEGRDLRVDAGRAVERTFREQVDWCAREVGRPLVPVGEAHHGYMVLMRAEDGAFYLGLDTTLGRLGENDLDAFERFVADAPLVYLRR